MDDDGSSHVARFMCYQERAFDGEWSTLLWWYLGIAGEAR